MALSQLADLLVYVYTLFYTVIPPKFNCNLPSSPPAKQRRNPCFESPPDWPLKKAIVDLPIRMKRNEKRISSNSLSPLGAQNKDLGAACQTLPTEVKLSFNYPSFKLSFKLSFYGLPMFMRPFFCCQRTSLDASSSGCLTL